MDGLNHQSTSVPLPSQSSPLSRPMNDLFLPHLGPSLLPPTQPQPLGLPDQTNQPSETKQRGKRAHRKKPPQPPHPLSAMSSLQRMAHQPVVQLSPVSLAEQMASDDKQLYGWTVASSQPPQQAYKKATVQAQFIRRKDLAALECSMAAQSSSQSAPVLHAQSSIQQNNYQVFQQAVLKQQLPAVQQFPPSLRTCSLQQAPPQLQPTNRTPMEVLQQMIIDFNQENALRLQDASSHEIVGQPSLSLPQTSMESPVQMVPQSVLDPTRHTVIQQSVQQQPPTLILHDKDVTLPLSQAQQAHLVRLVRSSLDENVQHKKTIVDLKEQLKNNVNGVTRWYSEYYGEKMKKVNENAKVDRLALEVAHKQNKSLQASLTKATTAKQSIQEEKERIEREKSEQIQNQTDLQNKLVVAQLEATTAGDENVRLSGLFSELQKETNRAVQEKNDADLTKLNALHEIEKLKKANINAEAAFQKELSEVQEGVNTIEKEAKRVDRENSHLRNKAQKAEEDLTQRTNEWEKKLTDMERGYSVKMKNLTDAAKATQDENERKIQQLQIDLQEARKDVQDFIDAMSEVEDKAKESEDKLTSVSQKLNEAIDKAAQQKQAADNQREEDQKQIRNLTKSLKEASKNVEELTTKLNEAETKAEAADKKHKAASQDLCTMKADRDGLKQANTRLQQEKQDVSTVLEEAKTREAELMKDKQNITTECQRLEVEWSNANVQIEALKAEAKDASSKVKELECKLTEASVLVENEKAAEARERAANELLASANAEVTRLQEHITVLQQKEKRLFAECQEARNEISNLNNENTSLRSTADLWRKESEKLQESINSLTELKKSSDEALFRAQADREDAVKNNEKAVIAATKEHRDKEAAMEEKKAAEAARDLAETEKIEALNKLKTAVADKEAEKENAQIINQTLESMRKQARETKDQIRDLEAEHQRIVGLKETACQEAVKANEESVKKAQINDESLKAEITRLQERIDQLEQASDAAEASLLANANPKSAESPFTSILNEQDSSPVHRYYYDDEHTTRNEAESQTNDDDGVQKLHSQIEELKQKIYKLELQQANSKMQIEEAEEQFNKRKDKAITEAKDAWEGAARDEREEQQRVAKAKAAADLVDIERQIIGHIDRDYREIKEEADEEQDSRVDGVKTKRGRFDLHYKAVREAKEKTLLNARSLLLPWPLVDMSVQELMEYEQNTVEPPPAQLVIQVTIESMKKLSIINV